MFVKENVCRKIVLFQERKDYGGMLLANDFVVLLTEGELAAINGAIKNESNAEFLRDCVVVHCVRCHCHAFTDENSLFKLLNLAGANPLMIYCKDVLSFNISNTIPFDGSCEVADGYCLG